ncbi:hypothetical protein ABPG75_008832 [Micractinium tetrahymenae]
MARAGIEACSPRLASWLPSSEAEPPGVPEQASAPAEEASATPSVLTKLQKWADYEAMGSPVWPTNFVPCKTPMSKEILDNWSLPEAPRHPLTVPLLLARQAALGREVGLIIDLANHDCLYSDDVPDSVEYEHVQLIAKVLPSREAINEVERIAKSFWAEHPSRFIAIHCAYGFNRTGFVVCSYLCQACGLTVEQALESFAAARPPGVKHEKFIRELHARYGGGPAVTPEGSVMGGSPPAAEALDGLAEEAERLRRAAAAAAANGGGDGGGTAAQGQASAGEEDGEPPHFEDAAYMVRLESKHRRSGSLSWTGAAGSVQALPVPIGPPPPPTAAASSAPLPRAASRSRTPSQPGSAATSRNPSRHGGSALQLDVLAAGAGGEAAAASEPAEDAAIASKAGEGFAASRRLMQRKSSRGGSGGLTLALAAGAELSRRSDGSPRSSESGATAGSPVSGGLSLNGGGVRTAQSSMSDFAAAAVHLEGASSMRRELGHSGSMRRSTSLGLAKALCEDFLQNNGTPSATAPITAAAEMDEEDGEERQGLAASQARPGSMSPEHSAAAAASQQLFGQSSEDGRPGSSQQLFGDSLEPEQAAVGAGAGEPACAGARFAAAASCEQAVPGSIASASVGSLSSSPSRRGGIPQPPGSRAQACCGAAGPQAQRGGAAPLLQPQQQAFQHAWQAVVQQQQQQQPGTPLTPGGPWSAGGSLSKQPSASGFPRSVSVDSDNPSLGFGMREALAHLRKGAAGGGDAEPHRGPQALADLFREDSSADVAALDVEEHLAGLALAAGEDSPGAPGLPRVVEASASAEAEAGLGPSHGSPHMQHQCCMPSRAAEQQPCEPASHNQRQEPQKWPGQQQVLPPHQPPQAAASPSTGAARGPPGSSPGRRCGRHNGGDTKGKCRLM